MKTLKSLTALLASVLVVASCSDFSEPVIDLQPDSESNFEAVAKMMSSIGIDLSICQEVHRVVTKSLRDGSDECLLFKEILPISNLDEDSFAPTLKKKIESCTTETKSDDTIFTLALDDELLQVYWPYSVKWDGITLPTITYQPKDKDQDWNWGYKLAPSNNGTIVKEIVRVDDDYAYENPVWIINNSNMSYETILDIRKQVAKASYVMTRSGDFHPWYLDQVRLTRQYDNLFQGVNNIKITITLPQITGYSAAQNVVLFTISRTDAREKNWVYLGRVLNDDWREEQITNHMLMVETDGGNEITLNFNLSLKVEINGVSTTSTVGASVKYNSNDDLINQWMYYRDVVMSYDSYHNYITSDGDTYLRMHIQQ